MKIDNGDTKKEKNKIKARESRKRKKNYISELEDKVDQLQVENRRLKEELEIIKQQLTKKDLGEDTKSLLTRVIEQGMNFSFQNFY